MPPKVPVHTTFLKNLVSAVATKWSGEGLARNTLDMLSQADKLPSLEQASNCRIPEGGKIPVGNLTNDALLDLKGLIARTRQPGAHTGLGKLFSQEMQSFLGRRQPHQTGEEWYEATLAKKRPPFLSPGLDGLPTDLQKQFKSLATQSFDEGRCPDQADKVALKLLQDSALTLTTELALAAQSSPITRTESGTLPHTSQTLKTRVDNSGTTYRSITAFLKSALGLD